MEKTLRIYLIGKTSEEMAKGATSLSSMVGQVKSYSALLVAHLKEGEEKYRKFTSTYKTLSKWWTHQKYNFGRKHGYVKTAFGRVQPYPTSTRETSERSQKTSESR